MKNLIIFLISASLVIIISGCTLITSQEGPTTSVTTTTSGIPYETSPVVTIPESETGLPASEIPYGLFQDKPVPLGQSAVNADGIEITVIGYLSGEQAWHIINDANSLNEPPEAGMEYVIVTFKAKNVSSINEPYTFYYSYFELMNMSGRLFRTYYKYADLPSEGIYHEVQADLNHGDEVTGSIHFYIPVNETDLTMVWSNINNNYKLFFAVK